MTEKFEVTKEAILAMVEKCPEAKEVLKAGFPGAFEKALEIDKKYFNLNALNNTDGRLFTQAQAEDAGFGYNHFMSVRLGGSMRGIAFVLDSSYNWEFDELKNNFYHLLIPSCKD